jgi:preprotein translocase subunit SecF
VEEKKEVHQEHTHSHDNSHSHNEQEHTAHSNQEHTHTKHEAPTQVHTQNSGHSQSHVSSEKPKAKTSIASKIKYIYENHYKKLLLFTLLIVVFSICNIAFQVITTGDFIGKDIDLKGGISIEVSTNQTVNTDELDAYLSNKFKEADIKVQSLSVGAKQTDIIVKSTLQVNETELVKEIKAKLGVISYRPSLVDSSFGNSFFQSAFIAMIVAFCLMGAIVFYFFRLPFPSFAVILCGISDVLCTVSAMNILGIKLTPGGVAALLMIVGYSVDTDILLSTRVLKRQEGTVMERVYSSMKTGMTMTITTMVAVLAALVFTNAEVLRQIMTILLIGLIFDIIMTWVQNVGLLRWWLENKEKKAHAHQEASQ